MGHYGVLTVLAGAELPPKSTHTVHWPLVHFSVGGIARLGKV